MVTPVMRLVGNIPLADVAAIRRAQGQDPLPYPFAHTPGLARRETRGGDGDLPEFGAWAHSYVTAKVWVSGRVHHRGSTQPDLRVLAHRDGATAYVATQRDDDTVDVFATTATDFSSAIAGSIGLTQPGSREQIVVPAYVGYFAEKPDTDDDEDAFGHVQVSARAGRRDHRRVADEGVTAITTVQSRSHPPRVWGIDWTEPMLACVSLDADGDYLYTTDYAYAVPATRQMVTERLDWLTAPR